MIPKPAQAPSLSVLTPTLYPSQRGVFHPGGGCSQGGENQPLGGPINAVSLPLTMTPAQRRDHCVSVLQNVLNPKLQSANIERNIVQEASDTSPKVHKIQNRPCFHRDKPPS